MTEEERYNRAWRRLRALRWILVALFLAYIPAMATLVTFFPNVPGQYFFFGWGALTFALVVPLIMIRCPSCGKTFTSSNLLASAFTSKCLNCGTRVGQKP
jgi:hypothetical protein